MSKSEDIDKLWVQKLRQNEQYQRQARHRKAHLRSRASDGRAEAPTAKEIQKESKSLNAAQHHEFATEPMSWQGPEDEGSNSSMKNNTGDRGTRDKTVLRGFVRPQSEDAEFAPLREERVGPRTLLVKGQGSNQQLPETPDHFSGPRSSQVENQLVIKLPSGREGEPSRDSLGGVAAADTPSVVAAGTPSPIHRMHRSPRHSHPSVIDRGLPYNVAIGSSSKTGRSTLAEIRGGAFAPGPSEPEQRLPTIIRQPKARSISQEQLVAEVKGIYAGLVMIEAKCMDVDAKQTKAAQEAEPGKLPELTQEQSQALIALHRTLLHEHHDFFLASQHPSASPSLRRLAGKYAMPARMWRHGIHSFLELLRHRLPGSLEYMLQFIYLAYSIMALLFETVPSFEATWIECLGDLARYRMAIEDEDPRDRDIWTATAREWYTKAGDQKPSEGRLQHHLAILSRGNPMQQLYFYSRSLTCQIPFSSTRESILTLINPILDGTEHSIDYRSLPVERTFVKCHGMLFHGSISQVENVIQSFVSMLDNYIGRVTARFREFGVFIVVSNACALFEYGSSSSPFRIAIQSTLPPDQKQEVTSQQPAKDVEMLDSDSVLPPTFPSAAKLLFSSFSVALSRLGDNNVLPFVHVSLVLIKSISMDHSTWEYVRDLVPWAELASHLNFISRSNDLDFSIIEGKAFPRPKEDAKGEKEGELCRPLPEDFAIWGQLWSAWYFPSDWFSQSRVDYEERNLERPSNLRPRLVRDLWLGVRISEGRGHLEFDHATKLFSTKPYAAQPTSVVQLRPFPYTSTTLPVGPDGDHDMLDLQPQEPSQLQLNRDAQKLDAGSSIQFLSEGNTLNFAESETVMDNQAWSLSKQKLKLSKPIVNLEFLLKDLDAFRNAIERAEEPVVVPNSVGVELEEIAMKNPSLANAARAALEYIRLAINEDKNIKIVTADGHNLTRQGGFIADP
ncbi:MAG: hypothetical protein M1824_002067 [Vezdaea acicularis]|nr:MAG: hypothetical protein M1824_002067 [Vezdaea acicularis]